MKTFIFYDEDGEILRYLRTRDEGTLPEIAGGQWMEVEPDEEGVAPVLPTRNTHYVLGDELHEYTEAQVNSKRIRPRNAVAWSNASMSWTVSLDLATAREQKKAELKAKRDEVAVSGFTWDGSTFDSDMDAYTKIIGMFVAAQAGLLPPTSFRLRDNTWRTLTGADLLSVGPALLAHIAGAFETFRIKETEVDNAEDIAAVLAVEWPST